LNKKGVVVDIKSNKPCGEKQIFKLSGKVTRGTNKIIRHAPLKIAQAWA